MIAQVKHRPALLALNLVLVRARRMAYEQAPHSRLAAVLDVAELLPVLISEERDRTADFRAHLEGVLRLDAGFMGAVQRFDGGTAAR